MEVVPIKGDEGAMIMHDPNALEPPIVDSESIISMCREIRCHHNIPNEHIFYIPINLLLNKMHIKTHGGCTDGRPMVQKPSREMMVLKSGEFITDVPTGTNQRLPVAVRQDFLRISSPKIKETLLVVSLLGPLPQHFIIYLNNITSTTK